MPSVPASQLDDFAAQRLERTGVPGGAYAVVGPGGVEHAATFGRDGDGRRVTRDTPFLWGSVSKPVAATLVLGLVRAGKLRLTDPVVDHLPEFRTADRAASARITVRALLQHTSGLPPALELTDRGGTGRRPRDVLPALQTRDLVSVPGTEHHYSSVNYLVLAAVVEAVTGESYADALDGRLLRPLGISNPITSSRAAADRLPAGHRYIAGRAVAFVPPYDPAGLAYGYLGGSIDELAAFARSQLTPRGTITTADELQQLHASGAASGGGGTYGLGWRRWPWREVGVRGAGEIVWHGGAAPGYASAVIVLPGQKRAIVLLQNAYGPFQEPALLSTVYGLAALTAGLVPPRAPSEPTYPVLLALLGLLTLGLVIALIRSAARITRGRRLPGQPRRVVVVALAWIVGLCGIGAALGLLVPSLYGLPLGRLAPWAPDIAWLLQGALAVTTLLAAARVGEAALQLHHHRSDA